MTTFSPLSGAGLCDAETMMAGDPDSPEACTRHGVVTTPMSSTSTPAAVIPALSAALSISPERRVSRPMRTLDAGVAEAVRDGPPEVEREADGDLGPDHAANPVRAEPLPHLRRWRG